MSIAFDAEILKRVNELHKLVRDRDGGGVASPPFIRDGTCEPWLIWRSWCIEKSGIMCGTKAFEVVSRIHSLRTLVGDAVLRALVELLGNSNWVFSIKELARAFQFEDL